MSSERASTLGAHLEELDRLLHDVQVELEPPPPPPVTEPPPPEPLPPPRPPDPALDHHTRALAELSERLLASMRELLLGYERILTATARPAAAPAGVTLEAAPLRTIEALHQFENALSQLPGVRDVAVRRYEGTDRAILDVRLT